MGVKEHYEKHLANFYAWMLGDLEAKTAEFQNLLSSQSIEPKSTKTAIDLGAGNGLQSIALKHLGFEVTAVDFNEQLLSELTANPKANGIKTHLANITEVLDLKRLRPELITCCGDTITHLENKEEIQKLISDSSRILSNNGHLVISFRDYTKEPLGQQLFIPVKSTDHRILTCILEYQAEQVKVTDLLHEKINGEWIQKVSSYNKVRIDPNEVKAMLEQNGMSIKLHTTINRMETIIAEKRP